MGYIDLLEKKEKERAALKENAFQEAERLSVLLREKFAFDALYLIGSLVRERGFSRHSDIDFVIKGLEAELFFKALAFLISETTFHIDLKPYEGLSEDSKHIIETKGINLR